jgi:polygalacturonase
MSTASSSLVFDVRAFGAKGDGITLDSPAINAAIQAAARSGGGTVLLPAGSYLCFSLRLCSRLELRLGPGSRIIAAKPAPGLGQYDDPEPNIWGDLHQYQDFGHSHWHNSLLWGEGLEDVSITGPGLIEGAGLDKDASYAASGPNGTAASAGAPVMPPELIGVGNKSIALRECRRVLLRDFSILKGGHFALLATGVDHLTIDNLRIDTNRDGLDIDGCRHVRVSNCSLNTPNDDAIVLKTSYALGALRNCENITITNCTVSGFDMGSMLDASFTRKGYEAPDKDGPTGRIKLGTESNGAFRNITISNCTFERSRGLALESVDGAIIEDVVVTGLAMRELCSSPIFVRLGNRARGPKGTPVGAIRRVRISQVSVGDSDGRFPILLAGLPGHPIEDLHLSDIQVESRGGISVQDVIDQSPKHVNAFFLKSDQSGIGGPRDPLVVPERPAAYPEPSMFGLLPASILYARHVSSLTLRDFQVKLKDADERVRMILSDVKDASLEKIKLPTTQEGRNLLLNEVEQIRLKRVTGLPDQLCGKADKQSL